MTRSPRPTCYGCDKKARKGSMFCSQRCAALYAEELLIGNDESWCPVTGNWEGTEGGECGGCGGDPDAPDHVRATHWAG